jgi:cell division transport system ATP-binding protein
LSTDAPTDPSPAAPQPSDPSESRSEARARAREARRATGRRADRRATLRPGDGPMVIFDEVTKAYGPNAVGVDDMSLSIESGEFVFLVGASGSGKSTFIRLLIKEVDATKGTVWVGGRNVTGMRRGKVPYLRRAIGCVFQDYKLLPGRTVYDNVAYALQVTGENPRTIRRKVPEMLSLVARAFVNHPRLLIADEPTGNLDPETSIGIMQLLYRINRTGTTVIMATHDRELVDKMQMRVIELQDGKLIRDQRQARYARAE